MIAGVAGVFPTAEQITRTILRTRKTASIAPTNPKSLAELTVPANYCKTLMDEDFLLYDSGPSLDRVLLFSTEKHLQTLGNCEHWYSDGTFKASPSLFTQVFTIHAVKNRTALPLVYGLLLNKQQRSYERFLAAMNNICHDFQIQLAPKSIPTDFETASLNAFDTAFPMAEQRGCYFHHTQCIWRHVQKSPNILAAYNRNPDFSLYLRQLPALEFVPTSAVTASYDVLMNTKIFKDNDALLRPITDYYEDTWIGRPRTGRRAASLFSQDLWNCNQATADGNPRTNNSVEGWHKRFSTLLGADHRTIWKFINTIKEEHSVTEMKLNQIVA